MRIIFEKTITFLLILLNEAIRVSVVILLFFITFSLLKYVLDPLLGHQHEVIAIINYSELLVFFLLLLYFWKELFVELWNNRSKLDGATKILFA
jgi:phosphatidylglycerophosphate synthase